MIQFNTDNGLKFDYPESLKDITLKQYLGYLELIEPTKPQLLKDVETFSLKIDNAKELKDNKGLEIAKKEFEDTIVQIDDIYTYQYIFPYYARVVSYFSGLQESVILGKDGTQGMRVDHLTGLYNHLINIFNNLPEVPFDPVIEVNDELWYLPDQFMTGSTVIEFAEAAQFQANLSKVENGEWKALAKMMCVLVKKKDEQYSDKLLKREEFFLSWNLFDCWRVAFFFLKRAERLKISLATYTNLQNLMLLKQELSS